MHGLPYRATRPQSLWPYGQRFLENGYQLPGREDGESTGKKKLGDVTLDDVGKYLAFRLVGHAVRSWRFTQQTPAGADAYVTNETLLSLRYDNLDAGGMLDQRTSATFLGVQAKQYLRSNVAIFVRNDHNLRAAHGGENAARNLRNGFFAGVDLIF